MTLSYFWASLTEITEYQSFKLATELYYKLIFLNTKKEYSDFELYFQLIINNKKIELSYENTKDNIRFCYYYEYYGFMKTILS